MAVPKTVSAQGIGMPDPPPVVPVPEVVVTSSVVFSVPPLDAASLDVVAPVDAIVSSASVVLALDVDRPDDEAVVEELSAASVVLLPGLPELPDEPIGPTIGSSPQPAMRPTTLKASEQPIRDAPYLLVANAEGFDLLGRRIIWTSDDDGALPRVR
jgi:hypothetical protein